MPSFPRCTVIWNFRNLGLSFSCSLFFVRGLRFCIGVFSAFSLLRVRSLVVLFFHVLLCRSGTFLVFAACWPFAYCEHFCFWDFGASALTSREIQFVLMLVLHASAFIFALVSSFRESQSLMCSFSFSFRLFVSVSLFCYCVCFVFSDHLSLSRTRCLVYPVPGCVVRPFSFCFFRFSAVWFGHSLLADNIQVPILLRGPRHSWVQFA